MELFRSRPEVREVVVKLLTNELSRQFTSLSSLALAINTRTTVEKLKLKLSGVTGVPVNRMLLLLCGQQLGLDKDLVPVEALEPIDVVDEDINKYRPHIFLCVMPEHDTEQQEEPEQLNQEEDTGHADGDGIAFEDMENRNRKPRRKPRHKIPYEKFELEDELNAADCVKFLEVLVKAGYDNEGAFANLTEEALRSPGLWIPKRAAERIELRAKFVRERMQTSMAQRRTVGREVENDMLTTQRIKPVALEGDQSGSQFITRAEMRRAWQHSSSTAGKNAKKSIGGAAHQHKAEDAEPAARRKTFSAELSRRIDLIKRQCADVAAAAEAEFEGLTGMLTNSSSRNTSISSNLHKYKFRSVHGKNSGITEASHDRRDGVGLVKLKLHPHHAALSATQLPQRADAATSNRHESAVENAHDSTVVDMIDTPAAMARIPHSSTITCCAKHCEMTMQSREAFIVQQRIKNELQLTVQLQQLRSFSLGFVKSQTLESIVRRKLAAYHGVPSRTADPTMPRKAVADSLLSLPEQRELIVWLQKKEAVGENFASVLPTLLYNPHKFIASFVDLLEQLDRDRM